jgi:peptidyl-prolyl cis-trans isomerase SurA
MLMSRQHLDAKALEKAIRSQIGLSMAQYRDQLTKQIHEQMLMARIRQRHIGVVQPTKQEVEKFFAEYKDSLPLQYNSILVSHIQIQIKPSKAIVDSVKMELAKLVDSLDQGIAWEVLAKRHSQDSLASKGGDLGFFRKGILEPEYERAAWKLDLGRYTDEPVKTRLGWHLIRILGKKDDEIRTAQILMRTIPSSQDSLHASQLIDSLKAVAATKSFGELAVKFSDDAETNWKKGSLGWMERTELDSAYQQVIANLDPGEISDKVKIDDSWHIFRLDQAKQSRELTLEDDYQKVEEFASNNIANKKLEKLVERWKKEVFIEIRNPQAQPGKSATLQ